MMIDIIKRLLERPNSSIGRLRLCFDQRAGYSIAQNYYWLTPLTCPRDGLFEQEEPTEPELPQ